MLELQDIFKVEYGNKFDMNKMNKTREVGGVNFVSRTSKNNGTVGLVEPVDNVTPYPKGLITVSLGGTYLLSSFVQSQPFYTGQNVAVLTPKIDMNLATKLFYTNIIAENRYRFSAFGREANRFLKTLQIPSIKEIPDWVEDYTVRDYKEIAFPLIQNKTTPLNTNEWVIFDITDIFDLSKGRYYPASSFEAGECPLVTSSDINNGHSKLTNLQPSEHGNCITIGKVGMVAFYQKVSFCCSHDVTVLRLKNRGLTPHIAMFILSVLGSEKYRWSYGRQIQLNACKTTKIKLPVDIFGSPDWQFMEDYIKSLPYSSSI